MRIGSRQIGWAIVVASSALQSFAQVAGEPVSIPDPLAMVKEIEAHQHRLDDIRENYTFHEIRQLDLLDKTGEIKSSTTEEREVFFVNGHKIRRLIKKNGEELSPSELKSEQNRVMKLVERDIKAPPGNGTERREGNITISQLLEMMTISNPRRISFHERATLAFDFIGDPEAKAHGLAPSAAKKMSGTLLIDEAAHQVTRIEVTFDEDFHIAGGLLFSIQKGTSISMEQSLVGDGLWMQTASETHLAARALLFDSLRQDMHDKAFDFRRFDIGMLNATPAKLAEPDEPVQPVIQ